MSILDEIFAHKRAEVEQSKRMKPLEAVRAEAEAAPSPVGFRAALREARAAANQPALIAEVKFASPSKGQLVDRPDPVGLASQYVQAGAAAVSVLTDEKYFQGRLEYLQEIHQVFPGLPLLRKDFLYDPYQVYEARAAGASAILLIAASLEPGQLADLHALANELELSALVEVHDRFELDAILGVPRVDLVGINNRDLRTFQVDLQTCQDLRPLVPPEIVCVAESGIHTRRDVERLAEASLDALLIGEALVTSDDPIRAIHTLYG